MLNHIMLRSVLRQSSAEPIIPVGSFTDNFNRTDGPIDNSWQVEVDQGSGTAVGNWNIISSQVSPVRSGGTSGNFANLAALAPVTVNPELFAVEYAEPALSTENSKLASLVVFGWQNWNNYYSFGNLDRQGKWQISQFTGGVRTVLIEVITPDPVAGYKIRLEVRGSNVQGFNNTTKVIDFTLAQQLTVGRVGFLSRMRYATVATRLDNFRIDGPVTTIGAPFTPPGTAAIMQATAAAAKFTDSVGVNTHWDYLDTPYGQRYNDVKQRLIESRIQHTRGFVVNRADDLKASNIYTTIFIDSSSNGDTPANRLALAKPYIQSGAVIALEGPNEPDLFWFNNNRTYNGQPFPAGSLQWQKDFYQQAKADPILAAVPIIGMSFGKTYWGGGHPYSANQLEDSTDKGNFHPYPSGIGYMSPYNYAGITNYYNNTDFPSIGIDVYPINLTTYKPPFGNLPMMATETGYSTWKRGQSEAVHGKYMPRVFLENFRLGIERTYTYELLDEFVDPNGDDREKNFGLIRHDLSPKPAFTAIKNMMTIIGDLASSTATAQKQLQYSLFVNPPAGYNKRYLHHVVLQKADGSFVIALWHEVGADDLSGFYADQSPIVEVAQPPMAVNLKLNQLASTSGITIKTFDIMGELLTVTPQINSTWLGFDAPDRVTLVTIPAH